jgi:Zn-dependent M28 family amino/carboxypeptidase
LSIVFLFASIIQAAPILIEVNLEKRADFDLAKNLNPAAWARWGNVFIVQIEEADLFRLDQQGIKFEVLTRFPKVQRNYLLSPHPGKAPDKALQILSKPVLNRAEQRFAQLDRAGLEIMKEKGYHALEIGEQKIPFTYAEPAEVPQISSTVADWIQDLVDQVSQDSLYAYTLRLQNFQTRYSYSDSIASARQWIVDKFGSFGIDSVYLDHYFYDSDQWNVVATVPGTAEPDALIIVGGHYDSVTYNQSPGPLTYAPGADDNGSGTAATLELARIIANNPLPQTVVFIPFAQEEQGLRGSAAYAAEAFSRGDDIRFMLNMDMIGYKPNNTNVRLYHDTPSTSIADLMVDLASTYGGLTGIKGSASGNSDHWPFMQRGWPAVFVHEYIFNNQGWHKNTDVTDSMNFDYMTRATKLAMATIASLSQNSCADYAGDLNDNNTTTLEDIIYLVNYIFNKPGGPWSIDPFCSGDVNGDSDITLSDVIHLVNFIFGKPGDWSTIPTGTCCAFSS